MADLDTLLEEHSTSWTPRSRPNTQPARYALTLKTQPTTMITRRAGLLRNTSDDGRSVVTRRSSGDHDHRSERGHDDLDARRRACRRRSSTRTWLPQRAGRADRAGGGPALRVVDVGEQPADAVRVLASGAIARDPSLRRDEDLVLDAVERGGAGPFVIEHEAVDLHQRRQRVRQFEPPINGMDR